jgi:hypothetical protein
LSLTTNTVDPFTPLPIHGPVSTLSAAVNPCCGCSGTQSRETLKEWELQKCVTWICVGKREVEILEIKISGLG